MRAAQNCYSDMQTSHDGILQAYNQHGYEGTSVVMEGRKQGTEEFTHH